MWWLQQLRLLQHLPLPRSARGLSEIKIGCCIFRSLVLDRIRCNVSTSGSRVSCIFRAASCFESH
jgi:hypothetical protein